MGSRIVSISRCVAVALASMAASLQASYVYQIDSLVERYDAPAPALGYSGYAYVDGSANSIGGIVSHDFLASKRMSVTLQPPAGQQFFVQATPTGSSILCLTLGGSMGVWDTSQYGPMYPGSFENLLFADLRGGTASLQRSEVKYGAGEFGGTKTFAATVAFEFQTVQELTFSSISFDLVAPSQLNATLQFNGSPNMKLTSSAQSDSNPGHWFGVTVVPEPSMLAVVCTTFGVLLRRRRQLPKTA